MGIIPEPEGVDFVVTGGITDPEATREVSAWIAAHKAANDRSAELREAQEILDAIKINPRDYGLEDAISLLDHWKHLAGVSTAKGGAEGSNS